MSRTSVDFSEHELHVTKTDEILIHHLKKPNTIIRNVKFINTQGIMAVTGDYGNWIFCREFRPSAGGSVSDGYWVEKLTIRSTQQGRLFSTEDTREVIQAGLDGELEEYGYEGDKLLLAKKFYEELLEHVDLFEHEYLAFAHNSLPDFMDHESVPFQQVVHPWLKAVFDAFEEICRREKEKGEQ